MPESGKGKQWLEEEFRNLKSLERGDVDGGRVSGTVYHVSAPFLSSHEITHNGMRWTYMVYKASVIS